MALPTFLEGILSGVRILDMTRMLAGPYGSLLLADLGAEIIKIERPGVGDDTRNVGKNSIGGLASYFVSINRGKLSVTLDPTRPEGRQVFHELVGHVDVVFNNYRPTALEKLGCDPATLRAVNPRVITCSLSGFGKDGPYRSRPAFDLIVQAMGGGMSITGEAEGDPCVMGLHIGDQAGGMFAAFAIAAALYQREKTGKGQDIDIGMLDCQVSLLAFLGQAHLVDGSVPGRLGSAHPLITPFKGFKTSDSYIAVVAFQDKHFALLCDVLGLAELPGDARFDSVRHRSDNHAELYPLLEAEFRKETAAHWLEILEKADIPCGPINDIEQALADPQVKARKMVVEQDNAVGRYKALGNPIKSTAQEDAKFGPPPRLGEHTELVLKELLGKTDEEIAALREAGAI